MPPRAVCADLGWAMDHGIWNMKCSWPAAAVQHDPVIKAVDLGLKQTS